MKLTYLTLFLLFGLCMFSTPNAYSDVHSAPGMATSSTKVWQLPHRTDTTGAEAYARSIHDLQLFDNKLFLTHGNWDPNKGPVYVYAMSVDSSGTPTFVHEQTLKSDTVLKWQVHNNTLIAPDHDPGGGSGLAGDWYMRDASGNWTSAEFTHELHILATTYWQGHYYTSVVGEFLYRSPDGTNWTNISDPNATDMSYWEMVPLSDAVWIGGFSYRADIDGVAIWNGSSLIEVLDSSMPDAPGRIPSLPRVGYISRACVFNDEVLYTRYGPTAPLYHCYRTGAPNGFAVKRIAPFDRAGEHQPGDYNVADIIVRNGLVYVLAQRVENNTRLAEILVTDDLQDWIKLTSVPVPAFPRSFELIDGWGFLGLSANEYERYTPHAGEIHRIDQKLSDLLPDGGVLRVESALIGVSEETTTTSFTVKRVLGSTGPASVTVSTTGGTATSAEYTALSQTLTWADGDTTDRTVHIQIHASDTQDEPDKTLLITLSNATGVLLETDTITLMIEDDDGDGPGVDAGADTQVPWSNGPLTHDLAGAVSHPTGFTTYWSVEGPAPVIIEDPTALNTRAEFSAAGRYELTLTAEDGLNLPSMDTVVIEILESVPANIITSSEAGAYAGFGHGVAVFGDHALVGARFSINSPEPGGIHHYKRTNGTWQRVEELTLNDGNPSERTFQNAYMDANMAVFIDQSNNHVLTFTLSNDRWLHEDTLQSANGWASGSLAVGDNIIVLGAEYENSTTGETFVFERTNGIWAEAPLLTAPDGASQDAFGKSVAVSGDYIAVTAPGHGRGAVYMYKRTNGQWAYHSKLTSPSHIYFSLYGHTVAMLDDLLLVGATNNGLPSKGRVLVYHQQNDQWHRTQELFIGDGDIEDSFGFSSIVLSDTHAMIAAKPMNDISDGVHTGETTNFYIYDVEATNTLRYRNKLVGPPGATTEFGFSISMSADTVMITDRSDGTIGPFSGAVYYYDIADLVSTYPLHANIGVSTVNISPNTPLPFIGIGSGGSPEFPLLSFSQGGFVSFGGKDGGTVNVTGGGLSVAQTAIPQNDHRAYPFTYSVTANTILRVDYSRNVEGHVHAIGLTDNVSNFSLDNWVYLDGSSLKGNQSYRHHGYRGGNQLYEIPLGHVYTGDMTHLLFVTTGPGNDSLFSNIKLYEWGQKPPYSYAWDFDNDGNTDSTEPYPSHAYTTAGTYTATLTVSDGTETATDTVTITVNSPYSAGYTNWVSAFNWAGETATAPDDNPDGDDLSNFLEYALGSNPVDGTSSHLPTFLRNGNAFDVTFRRERASATYTLQSSTDLVTWTDESINPGTIGADVTESIPMGSEELLFIRLKVEE